jgi:hypothetical protein
MHCMTCLYICLYAKFEVLQTTQRLWVVHALMRLLYERPLLGLPSSYHVANWCIGPTVVMHALWPRQQTRNCDRVGHEDHNRSTGLLKTTIVAHANSKLVSRNAWSEWKYNPRNHVQGYMHTASSTIKCCTPHSFDLNCAWSMQYFFILFNFRNFIVLSLYFVQSNSCFLSN